MLHIHFANDLLHHRLGAWRASHNAGAQAGQIKAIEFRVVELGDKHGRYAMQGGTFFLGDNAQDTVRFKGFTGEDSRRAMANTTQVANHHAEAMVERYGDAHLVFMGKTHHIAVDLAIIQHITVR